MFLRIRVDEVCKNAGKSKLGELSQSWLTNFRTSAGRGSEQQWSFLVVKEV